MSKNTNKINKEIEEKNDELEKENENLTKSRNELELKIQESAAQLQGITIAIKNSQDASDQSMIASAKAFDNYMEVLENSYKQTGEEYDKLIKTLADSYDEVHDKIITAIQKEQIELDTYRNTRTAAMEAYRKEQEIREQLEFYCLHPTEIEKDDIKELEKVKPRLHQPRILSMLI